MRIIFDHIHTIYYFFTEFRLVRELKNILFAKLCGIIVFYFIFYFCKKIKKFIHNKI